MNTREKKEDDLTKIAERFCIFSEIDKHRKDGISFARLKQTIKMKESRLRARLHELEEHSFIYQTGSRYKSSPIED